jgi:hypothetical protein
MASPIGFQRSPVALAAVPLQPHKMVRLRADFAGPEGTIPAGTLGTILQVFDRGTAYQVEFEGPHEAPETVSATLLEPARGAT